MNLLELQRRMTEDVCRPLAAGFAMQRETADGRLMSDVAETYVKGNDRLDSFERLEIYNRQYWFRVIGAVSEDYPTLAAVVGPKRFDELVLGYLKETPSTSFNLRNLGARLPEWLEGHAEFAGRRHALALDVARLEWAYIEAFDLAAMAPLTQEDLGGATGDSKLRLQPHIQLLALRYPVDELVLAVHRATPDSDIVSSAATERKQSARVALPPMRRSAIHLAVHRFENSIYYRRIEREAFQLLSALQRGGSVEEAVDAAFVGSKMTMEEQTQSIQGIFAHAAELGWFCRPQASTSSF